MLTICLRSPLTASLPGRLAVSRRLKSLWPQGTRRLSTADQLAESPTSTSSTSTPEVARAQQPGVEWQGHFVDVNPLALQIRKSIRDYTSHRHQSRQRPLKLIGILATHHHPDNPSPSTNNDSLMYSQRISETCREDGIEYRLWECPANEIQHAIQQANDDDGLDGILVFYPIFPAENKKDRTYKNQLNGVFYKTPDCQFRDMVCWGKDVEGLRGTQWYHNPSQKHHPPLVYPCTARAVEAILEHYHVVDNAKWQNQVVSIVNRSEIVGRPLASLLASRGATVYSLDASSTVLQFAGDRRPRKVQRTLPECLAESHMVVTGVPQANFRIPTAYLAEGATVVNVSEYSNVFEEDLAVHRPDLMYIPQVGKVTVAILEDNLVRLYKQKEQGSQEAML